MCIYRNIRTGKVITTTTNTMNLKVTSLDIRTGSVISPTNKHNNQSSHVQIQEQVQLSPLQTNHHSIRGYIFGYEYQNELNHLPYRQTLLIRGYRFKFKNKFSHLPYKQTPLIRGYMIRCQNRFSHLPYKRPPMVRGYMFRYQNR